MRDPYRIFPVATTQQRSDLRASLEAVGLQHPVIMDEHGDLIDGHERRDSCIELGIDWMVGADVRLGLSEIQKKALAIELNLFRRPIHLSRAKRNELLDIYLIAHPELSEAVAADLFGVNQSTVNRRKQRLMQTHGLRKVSATVGRDGILRRMPCRRQNVARLITKGAREFESLQPALVTLKHDLRGLQRRPKRLLAIARRQEALERVNRANSTELPANIQIQHCDFRDLDLPDGTVDVVLTDVVWSPAAERDWAALATLAQRWLKPTGLFCSIVGPQSLYCFSQVISQHLAYQWTLCIKFATGYRSNVSSIHERWRPVVIFSKAKKSERLDGLVDLIQEQCQPEKEYHNWQQPLPTAIELVKRLTRSGDTVVDPHVGTGTNAVACSLIGDRTFVGCDIDAQQIRTAKYRVASEGRNQLA